MQAQPIFAKLRQTIRVELVPHEELFPDEHKYARMSRGHGYLTQRCFEDRAIAININPDSVYPDGSVATALALAQAGKRVALCTAIRFDMDGVDAELAASGLLKPGQQFGLPKRLAVAIGLRNLHPESMASNWDAPNFGHLHPDHNRKYLLTCCFWKVFRETGVIILTHNWAPFMINYRSLTRHNIGALDGRALDGNYIFENFWTGDMDGIHISRDSDELFLMGLTPSDEMVPPDDKPSWLNKPILGQWSRGYILNRTVFDPNMIIDHATYENPALVSEGIRYVLVNGKLALRDGKVTG